MNCSRCGAMVPTAAILCASCGSAAATTESGKPAGGASSPEPGERRPFYKRPFALVMGCLGALALFLVIVVIVLAAAGALDKPQSGSSAARKQDETMPPQQPPDERPVASQEATPFPAAPSASPSVERGPTGDPRTDAVIAKLRQAHMLIDGRGEAFADLHVELGRHETAEFLEGTLADDLVRILSKEDSSPEEVRALLRSMGDHPAAATSKTEDRVGSGEDGFSGMSGKSILDLLIDLRQGGGNVSGLIGKGFSADRNSLFEVESVVGDFAIYRMRGARSPYRVAISKVAGRFYGPGQLLPNEAHVLTGMREFETVLGATKELVTLRPLSAGDRPSSMSETSGVEQPSESAERVPTAAAVATEGFRGYSGQSVQDLVYSVQGRGLDVSKLVGLAYRGVAVFRVGPTVGDQVIYGFAAGRSHFRVAIRKQPGRFYGEGQVMPNRHAGGRDEYYVLSGVDEFTTVLGTTEQVLTLRAASDEERGVIESVEKPRQPSFNDLMEATRQSNKRRGN